MNKNSTKYTYVTDDEDFVSYLKSLYIKTKVLDITEFSDKLTGKCSAVVLVNNYDCLTKENMVEFCGFIFNKLEYGGVFLVEIPDRLMVDRDFVTPEHFERVCQGAGFGDIRTYKTPLNSDGIYSYVVISRKFTKSITELF